MPPQSSLEWMCPFLKKGITPPLGRNFEGFSGSHLSQNQGLKLQFQVDYICSHCSFLTRKASAVPCCNMIARTIKSHLPKIASDINEANFRQNTIGVHWTFQIPLLGACMYWIILLRKLENEIFYQNLIQTHQDLIFRK